MDTSRIPFGSFIDRIRQDKNNDDDFETAYTYGQSEEEENDRPGVELFLVLLLFVVVMVLVRYGCILFIDYVILCKCRRNRASRYNGNQNDDRDNNSSNDNDNADGVDIELAECNDSTKELLEGLTLTEKRSLFSSILECRKATKSDIQIWKQANHNSDGGNNRKTEASSGVPESNRSVATSDTPDLSLHDKNRSRSDTMGSADLCCPICIQDIQVGDDVCYSKYCEQHLFHLDCIVNWLSTGSTLCPCCRRVILTRTMLEESLQEMSPKRK